MRMQKDEEPVEAKRIGDLNGPWSVGLRLAILMMPLLVTFSAWQVTQIMGLRESIVKLESSRVTANDVLALYQVIGEMRSDIAVLKAKVVP